MTHDPRVHEWEAARTHPATYPGRTPPGDYLILDDRVLPVVFTDHDDVTSAASVHDGRRTALDAELRGRGLPGVAERTPVVAYGGNRNPATLALKLRHYDYAARDGGVALPVLRGRLRDADTVAAGVSGQGYLYADLVLLQPDVCADALEVWVALVDDDQLRVLHESEGVDEQWYHVARIDDLELDAVRGRFHGLAYVTDLACPLLPTTGAPLAFSSVPAQGRRLEEATPVEMLRRFIDEHGIRPAVARITGLPDSDALAGELIKYLNGQWWYQRHTGERAIPQYYEVIDALTTALRTTVRHFDVVARLRRAGRILEGERRHAPGLTLTASAWSHADVATDTPPVDASRPHV
ncbi:MAG TPA: hypothetical protein VK875_08455 [Euzebyales bacterium]|nr:hypothetical protein [Euzebyales bacterium]